VPGTSGKGSRFFCQGFANLRSFFNTAGDYNDLKAFGE